MPFNLEILQPKNKKIIRYHLKRLFPKVAP